MTPTPAASPPAGADPTDPLAEWAASSAARMDELAEIGMGMARSLKRMAQAADEEIPIDAFPQPEIRAAAESLMRTFAKVARTVRQSVWLQGRILKDQLARKEAKDAQAQAEANRVAVELEVRRRRGGARRALAIEMAVDAIRDGKPERPEYERLMDDLGEHPDIQHPEEADFAERDVTEMALAFCKAIGVDPGRDWWSDAWGVELDPGYPPPEPAEPRPPP